MRWYGVLCTREMCASTWSHHVCGALGVRYRQPEPGVGMLRAAVPYRVCGVHHARLHNATRCRSQADRRRAKIKRRLPYGMRGCSRSVRRALIPLHFVWQNPDDKAHILRLKEDVLNERKQNAGKKMN